MTRLPALLLLLAGGVLAAAAVPGTSAARQEPARAEVFATADVLLDTGAAELAAWQVELVDAAGAARITGVEGSDHPAFREAPRYDPAALRRGRIRLAAFRLDGPWPTGRTRVARVHYVAPAGARVDFRAVLQAAAGPDGERIEAKVTVE